MAQSPMPAPSPATSIGARIPRRELKRLLSGHGRYIDDIKLPRMLHACFVRSPHPHAKIVSVDIDAAKRAPMPVAGEEVGVGEENCAISGGLAWSSPLRRRR